MTMLSFLRLSFFRMSLLPVTGVLLLAGCGGDDVGGVAPEVPTITIDGVAATGTPVAAATVTLRCSSGASHDDATTDANGRFAFIVPPSHLPCALRVSGGGLTEPLHSLASGSGTTLHANLTPMSDLVVARALQTATGSNDLEAWFNGTPANTIANVNAALPAAIGAWTTAFSAMGNYGVGLPVDFNPVAQTFIATAGNPYDDLLESFSAALAAATTTLAELRVQLATTSTPADVLPPPENGTGMGTGDLAVLGEMNGARVTVAGHTWALVEAVGDRSAANGFRKIDFNQNLAIDRTPFAGRVGVMLYNMGVTVAVQAPGTQTCGGGVAVQLTTAGNDASGNLYTATACSIDVHYVSPRGGIAGVVTSATLGNAGGQTVQITNAPFRAYRHNGPGAAKTTVAVDARMSMFVDSGNFEFPQGREFQLRRDVTTVVSGSGGGTATPDGTKLFTGNASDNVVLNVQNASDFFPGARSYNCGEVLNGRSPLNMQLWMGEYRGEYVFRSANSGGSCTLNITQKSGRYFSGTYTATLVGDAHSSTVLTPAQRTLEISGSLRNFRIDPHQPDAGIDMQGLTGDGASMTVNNGNFIFDNGDAFVLAPKEIWLTLADRFTFLAQWGNGPATPRWDSDFIRGDNGFDIILHDVPRETGTWQCGTGYSGIYPYLQLDSERVGMFNSTVTIDATQALIADASCTITVSTYDAATGTIAGTYTARLVNPELAGMVPGGDATVRISGSFRRGGLILQ